MAYKDREEVGTLESIGKRMGVGGLNIAESLVGYAQGATAGLGFKDASFNLGVLADVYEGTAKEMLESVGGTQTVLTGEDSIKSKFSRGDLAPIDVGRAALDIATMQAPQFLVSAKTAKMGSRSLSPLISKALPKLEKKQAQALGSMIGGAAGAGTQITGSIYREQEEKDFGKASMYGAAAGALEAGGLLYGASKAGLGKYLAGEMAETGVRTAGQIAKDVGKAALAEGATEFSQTGLEQLGADQALNFEEMSEAAIAGAFLGGAIPSISAPITNKLAKNEAARLEGIKQAEEEAAAKATLLEQETAEDALDDKAPVSMKEDAVTLDESIQANEKVRKAAEIEKEKEARILAVNEAAKKLDEESVPDAPYHETEHQIAAETGEDIVEVRKAASTFFESAKNFGDWSAQMVSRFGKLAKDTLLKLWNYVKGIQPGLSLKEVTDEEVLAQVVEKGYETQDVAEIDKQGEALAQMRTAGEIDDVQYRQMSQELKAERKDSILERIAKTEAELPDGRNIKFNTQQVAGLKKISDFIRSKDGKHKTFMLQGYAGTGKTTLIKQATDAMAETGMDFRVVAPTHKAARVINKSTGVDTTTLHKMLSMKPQIDYKTGLQSFVSDDYGDLDLPFNGVVVVDEASMIDRKMLDLLKTRASEYGTKVIFMGDEAQIPPVNEGDISQSFTTSDVNHQLTRVERTAAGNPLMLIFDKIREDIKSKVDIFKHESKIVKKDGEFHGVGFTSRPQSFAGAIKKAFGPDSKWQTDPDSARVIAYTNKQVAKWNQFVRREMWGESASEQFLPGELLIAKDNVYDKDGEMVVSNSSEYRFNELLDSNTSGNYGYTNMNVTNADGRPDVIRVVHTPQQVQQYEKHMKGLEAAAKGATNPSDRRKNWQRFYAEKGSGVVVFGQSKFATMDYGYAITAHKAQGSTFETVFIDEDNLDIRKDRPKEKKGFGDRERNSLKYVAFSRASRMAVVLSSKTTLDFMDKGFSIEEIVETEDDTKELRQAVVEAIEPEVAVLANAADLEAEFDDYVERGYYSAWYRDKVKEVGQEQADEASRLIRIKKATDELGFEPELADDNSTILNADHLIDENFKENLNRIMVGNHGVYFEFNKAALEKEFAGAKFIKKRKQYDEHRTTLGNKLYVQTDTVNYADYKKGAIYLSKDEMFAEAEGYVDTGGVALLEDEKFVDPADLFGPQVVENPQDGKPSDVPTIDAEVEIDDMAALFALPKVPDLPENAAPKDYAEHFDAYQEAKRSKDWFQHVKQKVGYKEANKIMQQIREYRVFQYFGKALPVADDGTVDVRGVEWFNPVDMKNFERVVAASHGVFVEYKGENDADGGVHDADSYFSGKIRREGDRFYYTHYTLTVGERQVFAMEMLKKMNYAPFRTGAFVIPLYATDLIRDHKTIKIDSVNGEGFVSPGGKVIKHEDIDTFFITERHKRKKGGEVVSIVIKTKAGDVFATQVNHFSLQAYFKRKSKLSHHDRKELRRIAHDQLFHEGQLDESLMTMFSEEERLADYEKIADEIEKEGREDNDFTGESWFDLFKSKSLPQDYDAEDNFLDALGYRPGAREQIEQTEKTQAKEEQDAAAVERRFSAVKKLKKEGQSQAHVVKEAYEQMGNSALLSDEGPSVLQWGKTGVPIAIDETDQKSYRSVISDYLTRLGKVYDVRTVINYILEAEGNLYSLSQLTGFPNSLDEFLEYVRQQRLIVQDEYVEKVTISEEGKQTRTVKTLEAIQQKLPFDTYNRGEKAIRKFMSLPNNVLNTITQYFDGDYEDIVRGEKLALQEHLNEEFSEYNPETRKVSNIYFPFAMVEILIMAAEVKHKQGVKFPPLRLSKDPVKQTDAGYVTKERIDKSKIKVGPTASAQPQKPKTKTIERDVAKVSVYEAFKAQAKTNKLVQDNWVSFYQALDFLAQEGLKTKGSVYQPQRVAAAMMAPKGGRSRASQEFRDLGRAETRALKKHGYDVGVRQEHIDLVMQMWQNTRILDGTFDYHTTKLEAIGDLNIENFELLRGISQLGDSLPLRLTDEQETRRQFIPTVNTRGAMVYDVRFFSEVTGEEIIQEALTGTEVETMREAYADLEVTNARGLGSEKLIWVQWETETGWSEPVRMTVAKFKANKRTSKTAFKVSESEDSSAVIEKKRLAIQKLIEDVEKAKGDKKKALMRKLEHQKRAYIEGVKSNWTQLFDWTHEDDMKRLVELSRRRTVGKDKKPLVSNAEIRTAVGYYRELKSIVAEIILVEEEGGDTETLKSLYDERRGVEDQIGRFHIAVKARLAHLQYKESNPISPVYFEKIAKMFSLEKKAIGPEKAFMYHPSDTMMGADDFYKVFLEAGSNMSTFVSMVSTMVERQMFTDLQPTYRELLEKIDSDSILSSNEDVLNYVSKTLPDEQNAPFLAFFRTGTTEGLDTITKARFKALRQYINLAFAERDIAPQDVATKKEGDVEKDIRLGKEKKQKMNTSIADKMAEQDIRPNLHEFFHEKVKRTTFEEELIKEHDNLIVGKLNNSIAHGFYNLVARAFGADLTIVSSDSFRSRYIGESSDGRSKIVINVKRNTSFHSVFAHELFHHVVNKANPATYNRFRDAVKAHVNANGNPTYSDLRATTTGDNTNPEYAYLTTNSKGEQVWVKGTTRDAWGVAVHNLTSRTGDPAITEEEILAELFASMMSSKEFYASLAKTFEGKMLGGKLISRLLTNIVKIADVNGGLVAWDYSHGISLRSHDMAGMYDMVSDMMFSGYVRDKKAHKDVRYHTTTMGTVTEEQVKDFIENPKQRLKGVWNTILPPGSRNRVGVMNQIEKLLGATMKLIKKLKPSGIYAYWLADPAQVTLMSKLAHGTELETSKAYHSVVKKHEKVFKGMSKSQLEKMHDDLVRGEVDVTTDEGAAKARSLGYGNDIIAAFKDYKTTADAIYEKLKKIYPDLPNLSTHYGQSLKWRKKDGIDLDQDFDWIVMPEKSQLEGSKHWQKEMNMKDSTREIGEKHKIVYKTIDPHLLFLEYVRDTNKLLLVKDFIDTAAKTNGKNGKPIGKLYTMADQFKAAEEGYVPIDDNALKLLRKMNLPMGYKVKTQTVDFESGEIREAFVSQDGQDVVYSTEEQANAAAKVEQDNAAIFGMEVATEVISEGKDPETVVAYYEVVVKKGKNKFAAPRRYETHGEAEMAAAQLQAKYPQHNYEVEAKEVTPQEVQTSQYFFQEDTAHMMNTLLAKDNVRNGKLLGVSGQWVMKVKNFMTSIEFALSMFHAMTIGQEMAASYTTWAWAKGRKGKVPIANIGKAWGESRELNAMLEAVLADDDLATNPALMKRFEELLGVKDPDIAKLIKLFHYSGGLLHQDVDLRTEAHGWGDMNYTGSPDAVKIIAGEYFYNRGKLSPKAMKESFKEVYNEAVLNEDPKVVAMLKVGAFGAMESTNAWLMEFVIPRAKSAMYLRELTLNLEKAELKIQQGLITEEEIARDSMRFIEDRFGEVNWKNMWMKPGYKTTLQFLFRSFTWFTGSFTALSKAGIDIAKLGWFTVKGEKYELTEKGYWGINAIASHIMTVMAINIIYSLAIGGGEEVPDDEETPWLTKLLFPRVDRLDPQARLTVPSYVSELYKIMRHTGAIGSHAEYTKLVSGRTNSLLSNMMDVYKGEDWRGVTISNHDASAPVRAWDNLAHIFGVSPISISTIHSIYQRKGWSAWKPMILAGVGFTDAPAAAKRSDAANKAFEIRRKEYKGTEITPEEMLDKESIKRAMYAYQTGDSGPLDALRASGEISTRQFRLARERMPLINGKKNPAYKNPLSQAIKGLTIGGAMEVWGYMTEAERKSHKREIRKKYSNMMARKDHSPRHKKSVREQMEELGIL